MAIATQLKILSYSQSLSSSSSFMYHHNLSTACVVAIMFWSVVQLPRVLARGNSVLCLCLSTSSTSSSRACHPGMLFIFLQVLVT